MSMFYSISESEMEIMQVIWASDGFVTSTQLLTIFADKDWKAQTMSTFLSRLVKKGILRNEKRGRTNLYVPAVTEVEYRSLEARNIMDNMYNGSLSGFLSALSGGKGLNKEEIEDIRAWFDEVSAND